VWHLARPVVCPLAVQHSSWASSDEATILLAYVRLMRTHWARDAGEPGYGTPRDRSTRAGHTSGAQRPNVPSLNPSALGFTAHVDGQAAELRATAKWARYEQAPSEREETLASGCGDGCNRAEQSD
jgi:hypothetical protein